jgi:hypothetical protein
MRTTSLFLGFVLILAGSAAACGSDVNEGDTTSSSTTGSGGGNGGTTATGGTGGTGGTTSNGGGGSTANGGNGGAGSLCDQACDKLATECGLGQVCSMPPVSNLLDCADPMADCPGQCILDADCTAILSLLGQNMDPALTACLGACQGGQGGGGGGGGDCVTCVTTSCTAEAIACSNEMQGCAQVLTCAQMCGAGDTACVNACVPAMQTQVTMDLIACAQNNCPACGL